MSEVEKCVKEIIKKTESDVVPVTLIDEVVMPKKLDSDLSQEEWDRIRREIIQSVESQGYKVD